MSLLLYLEPFQKFGVEEPEIIMWSQRLCGGQKAIKSSALVQTLDLKLGPSWTIWLTWEMQRKQHLSGAWTTEWWEFCWLKVHTVRFAKYRLSQCQTNVPSMVQRDFLWDGEPCCQTMSCVLVSESQKPVFFTNETNLYRRKRKSQLVLSLAMLCPSSLQKLYIVRYYCVAM